MQRLAQEDQAMALAVEFIETSPDPLRSLGNALLGMVEGSGDDDRAIAVVARRYVKAYRLVMDAKSGA